MAAHAHKPTEKDRKQVYTLAGMGVRHEDIARVMGISKPTLLKYYRDEVERGDIEANAKVAEALYKKATGNGQGSVTAAIFWLKTRARWREVSVHEHTGAEGAPIEIDDARAELAGLVSRIQGAAESASQNGAAEETPTRRKTTRRKAAKKKVKARRKRS